MTQNPLTGRTISRGPQFADDLTEPAERRTSVLAVVSLVVGVLGCVTFCIPGPGAIALVLGGVAVLMIGRSGGRLTGMGVAVTAIVLGLLSSLASIVVWAGGATVVGEMNRMAATPTAEFLRAADAGDLPKARSYLLREADTAVTDAALAEFAGAVRRDAGRPVGPPTGPLDMLVGGRAVSALFQPLGAATDSRVMPLPLRFEKGWALVGVVPVGQMGESGGIKGHIANVVVVTPDGKALSLLDAATAERIVGPPPRPPAPGVPPPPGSRGGEGPGTADAPKADPASGSPSAPGPDAAPGAPAAPSAPSPGASPPAARP